MGYDDEDFSYTDGAEMRSSSQERKSAPGNPAGIGPVLPVCPTCAERCATLVEDFADDFIHTSRIAAVIRERFCHGTGARQEARSWRDAIGAAPGFLGDEKSEDVIRRMRDGGEARQEAEGKQ